MLKRYVPQNIISKLPTDKQVLRTDIVMDVGDSLNPTLDIGQVEGAFTQGLGLFTLEELCYSLKGDLLTKGPGAYKIPGMNISSIQIIFCGLDTFEDVQFIK